MAVVLRGPVTSDDDLRGPAGATTPVTSLPDGTTTWKFTGEADGVAWTLEARRSPDGQVTIEARLGSTTAKFENPTPDRVFVIAATGGDATTRRRHHATVPVSAQVTLADGTVLPVDVLGDGDGIGVRLFVTSVPAGTTDGATVEAFGPDGTLLGTASL